LIAETIDLSALQAEAGENHPEKGGSYPGTQISYFQNRS
jgi:hypothetical protein